MSKHLLLKLLMMGVFASCASSSGNKTTHPVQKNNTAVAPVDPSIPQGQQPASLMSLPQTQHGGFVLSSGFYETEFKTYCLQPGTPDPSPNDAYLQAPVRGYRKEIVQSILTNSRSKPQLDQKNIQLLLWATVSGSDYNKLSSSVKATAHELLTQKQIFELKGGVAGLIKTVSSNMPSLGINNDMARLFEVGASSYETFERLAVLREPAKITGSSVKKEQWYEQEGNYYVRYFPISYQKVKIQVYMPEKILDSTGKLNGEYVVFDPTGWQAIPANTNAQRLGIGAPVLDVLRTVIIINKGISNPKKSPYPQKTPENKNPKGLS